MEKYFKLIENAYHESNKKHRPTFASTHEAYGVLLEEIEEWWDEIKADNLERAEKEIIQAGAMILKYLITFKDKDKMEF